MAKGHFNVLKGAYPSLVQLDKTLKVNDAVTNLVRGNSLRVDTSDNTWLKTADDAASKGAAGTPGPIIYFALQDQDQTDVEMAGALTALSCTMPMEVETDQYNGTPALGALLVGGLDGKVQAHADGETACGVVTKAEYRRFINDKVVSGTSTKGGFGMVLGFATIYSPDIDGV
jgi:hypothetical protein